MNEDEAKTKWCPFARNQPAINRGGMDFLHDCDPRCIGSECMAWRWNKDNRQEVGHDEIGAPERGYCGLAGKV